jgi:lipoprotein-anchoring transpeptidase ErfK/SrfK
VIAVVTALGASTGYAVSGARAAVEAEAAAAAISVDVSLANRELVVKKGSEVLARYPVAIGKANHETPKGSYRVRRMIWNPSWHPPDAEWAKDRKPTPPGDPKNPMGRVKIFFAEPDYYIHGTTDEKSVGRAASHGCIRMKNDDVIALGKLLMEHGGQSKPPSWFRRVINRVTDTQEVRLTQPVSMRVR